MNPESQQKLYDSLIEIYPKKDIAYDNLKDAPMLSAVVKESQRLYPAINVLFRKCVTPATVKGYRFEKGDVIGIDVLSLHNSDEFWPEPEKFRPERFMEKEVKIENDDSMTFLPFGAGEFSMSFFFVLKFQILGGSLLVVHFKLKFSTQTLSHFQPLPF